MPGTERRCILMYFVNVKAAEFIQSSFGHGLKRCSRSIRTIVDFCRVSRTNASCYHHRVRGNRYLEHLRTCPSRLTIRASGTSGVSASKAHIKLKSSSTVQSGLNLVVFYSQQAQRNACARAKAKPPGKRRPFLILIRPVFPEMVAWLGFEVSARPCKPVPKLRSGPWPWQSSTRYPVQAQKSAAGAEVCEMAFRVQPM